MGASAAGPLPLAMTLALSLACASRQQRPPDPAPMRPIPDQVAAFVRVAIADRHQAGDIPDQNLIAGQDPVLIFAETERPAYQLTPRALPAGGQTRFALIDRTAARARANGTRTGMTMIQVDGVELAEDTASLVLGIGIYPDESLPGFMMTCCCSARANFRLRGGQWSFVGWGERTCFQEARGGLNRTTSGTAAPGPRPPPPGCGRRSWRRTWRGRRGRRSGRPARRAPWWPGPSTR